MKAPRVLLSPGNLASGLIKLSLVAGLLIFISPPLRARAAPVVEPVINPMRRVSTADRVNTISRYLETESRISGLAPQDRDLPRVMKKMFPGRKDAMLDPWGKRYYLRRHGDGFQVASAGPDRRRGTRDDVVSNKRLLPGRRDHES